MRNRLLTLCIFVAACAHRPAEVELETPEDTVRSLLQAYHLWRTPETPATPWGPHREQELVDMDRVAACFLDFDRDDPASRAMAELVAAMLAAGQRRLVYWRRDGTAIVQTGRRDVALRRVGRGWVIVLRETVPPEIRDSLERGARNRRLPSPDVFP